MVWGEAVRRSPSSGRTRSDHAITAHGGRGRGRGRGRPSVLVVAHRPPRPGTGDDPGLDADDGQGSHHDVGEEPVCRRHARTPAEHRRAPRPSPPPTPEPETGEETGAPHHPSEHKGRAKTREDEEHDDPHHGVAPSRSPGDGDEVRGPVAARRSPERREPSAAAGRASQVPSPVTEAGPSEGCAAPVAPPPARRAQRGPVSLSLCSRGYARPGSPAWLRLGEGSGGQTSRPGRGRRAWAGRPAVVRPIRRDLP